MAACPPEQYERLHLSVGRPNSRSGYELIVSHYHRGSLGPCQVLSYGPLVWTELVDVMLVSADEYRPGLMPGGWEQLSLESSPSWEQLDITPRRPR